MAVPVFRGLVMPIKVGDYVTREFTWNDLWISTRARLNNIFFLLFGCKSRNLHQQVAQGAVRAQPCFNTFLLQNTL